MEEEINMAIIALENHHIDSSAVSKLWQSYKEYENLNIKLAETLSRCIPISVIEKKINELNEKMAEQLYIIKEFGEHKGNRGKLTMYKEQRDILIELLDERSNTDEQM